MSISEIYKSGDDVIYKATTNAPGPQGKLPFTAEMLMEHPSGDIFGMTMNAGMGWEPDKLLGTQVMVIGTVGGIRGADGKPVALGLHTGHYETSMLMDAAAREVAAADGVPYAAFVSDPCDGRTMGTPGMFDSLPYRNDTAIVFRRLIRSAPERKAIVGVAGCDKGLPALMMALASMHDLASVVVPGGATLMPTAGEDAGKVQSIGARFANHELTLETASEAGCRACASPGAVASSWALPARRRWWPRVWGWRFPTRPCRRLGSRYGSKPRANRRGRC